jgi:F-type H+-transporting ATPase subunit b
MALGLAVTSYPSAAQQPATSSAVPASTDAAPASKAAKSEKDEDNVYLHAPIVQTIGRVLHLDVETTAQIFVFINFAILVFGVGIPLVRIVPKVIRKRSLTLRQNIDTARKETEDAGARLSAVEAKLASLDDEIAKFRSEVEKEIVHDEARIKAALEEESARIVAGAEQEISSAAAQARRGLRNFAADLAIEQAGKQLVLTPETDQALIAEFISDVAGNGAARGGQN